MRWRLPERHKKRLKRVQEHILDKDLPVKARQEMLYKALLPSLNWAKDSLTDRCDLEPDEANNELFLLCVELLEDFDDEGNLLYFVETRTPWKMSSLLKKLALPPEKPIGLWLEQSACHIEEEMWPSSPKFLLENCWMAKGLSCYEKLLILKILTAEALSCRTLSESLGISKTSINEDLRILASKMKGKLSNGS